MTIDLREVWRGEIQVSQPFNFTTTLRKPSHFPMPLEAFEDDLYVVVTDVGGAVVGCEVRNRPGSGVELALASDAPLPDPDRVAVEIARRLGLLVDLTGFRDVWQRDPLLRDLDPKLIGGRPAMPHSLYGFLVICVLLQNTQIRRTVSMAEALLGAYGRRARFPSGRVLPALWPPSQLIDVSEDELQALHVGYRARTILRLSQTFHSCPTLAEDLLALNGEQCRSALMGLYGVGPATVGYLSFEWFKRCNELTHVSPWEARILSRLILGREQPADRVIEYAHERWAPFTMLAAHAVLESVFWKRLDGSGPDWLNELVRL